jgi:transporter family protein
MHAWFWLSILTLVFFGITGVTQKLSTNYISFEMSFVWFSVAFFVLSSIIMAAFTLDWHISAGLVALAALGGLLNGLGALASFAALEKGGKASVVVPIINVYPLVTIAGAWLLLGEWITWTQGVGIVCALIAVVLLSQEATPAKS